MKAYTDIEQSKKLAEILPITTIDFVWYIFSDGSTRLLCMDDWEVFENAESDVEIIPCWSLAALLEQIPSDLGSSKLIIEKYDSESLKYGLNYHDKWGREDDIQTKYYDNLVDACVEMIIKLH